MTEILDIVFWVCLFVLFFSSIQYAVEAFFLFVRLNKYGRKTSIAIGLITSIMLIFMLSGIF